MVCCTILAALLALLMKPLAMMLKRDDPLAWRLAPVTAPAPAAGRAASRLASFAHALEGWRFLVISEPNMRLHLVAAIAALAAGAMLGLPAAEWRWLIFAIALVLAAEALNTAVEQACNAVTRSYDPAIKAAKDVAAGGVLVTAVAAALIGASVLLPPALSALSSDPVLPATICGQ